MGIQNIRGKALGVGIGIFDHNLAVPPRKALGAKGGICSRHATAARARRPRHLVIKPDAHSLRGGIGNAIVANAAPLLSHIFIFKPTTGVKHQLLYTTCKKSVHLTAQLLGGRMSR